MAGVRWVWMLNVIDLGNAVFIKVALTLFVSACRLTIFRDMLARRRLRQYHLFLTAEGVRAHALWTRVSKMDVHRKVANVNIALSVDRIITYR